MTTPTEDNSPKRLAYEVKMMLSSVASHGPAALTTTDDPMYTAGLLRRLTGALIEPPTDDESAAPEPLTDAEVEAAWVGYCSAIRDPHLTAEANVKRYVRSALEAARAVRLPARAAR